VLLERETELNYIEGALRSAALGRGSTVVISGPLGIGKSALLRALPKVAATEHARCLWASGSALEQDFTLGVVRQLFGPLLLERSTELRERLLASSAAPALTVFDDHSRPAGCSPVDLEDAVISGADALVHVVGGGQPLLILLDDLHWADAPSQRWLERLVRTADRMKVVIASTVREGDPGAEVPLVREIAAAAHVLRPRRLTAAATRILAGEQFGVEPDDEFVSACQEMSCGVPLLARCLLLGLALQGESPVARAVEAVRTLRPASVRDRIIGSIRAQPVSVRKFVTALAVLGDSVGVDVAGRLAGLDDVGRADALRRLRLAGLLVGEVRPRFVHPIVQDAADGSMTAAERDELHLCAARELLSGGFPVEDVALQLLATALPLGAWEIDVLRSAAETALRRSAPEEATRYLRRALVDCPANGEDRASVLIDLAIATRGLDSSASVRYIEQAVLLFDSVREKAVVSARISPIMLTQASQPIRDLINQLADDLGEPSKLSGTDRLLALRLEARAWCTGHDDPLRLAAAAERLHSLEADLCLDTDADRELVAVLLHAGMLTSRVTAIQVASTANAILEREPATAEHVYTAIPMLVTSLVAADSVGALTSWLDTARQQASSQNALVELALINFELAFVLAFRGSLAEAKTRALDALRLTAHNWDVIGEVYATSLTGVALETRDEELTSLLLSRSGDKQNRDPFVRMLRTTAMVAHSGPVEVLDELIELGRLVERAGRRNPALFSWRTWAAKLHWQRGSADAAAALLWEQHKLAQDWGAPATIGRSLRMLGQLAEGRRGVALLHEAVATLETSGNRLELAKALLALGRRLREADEHGGMHAFQRGLHVAEDIGALALAKRIIDDAGGKLAKLTPAVRSALTKSERTVADLVVAGESNAEIATRLGVTRRAVEKHLTNSYRKLGIRGRDDLAAALDQSRGLQD
jgi:DNA-binding CsgD family transcriptional regulator